MFVIQPFNKTLTHPPTNRHTNNLFDAFFIFSFIRIFSIEFNYIRKKFGLIEIYLYFHSLFTDIHFFFHLVCFYNSPSFTFLFAAILFVCRFLRGPISVNKKNLNLISYTCLVR